MKSEERREKSDGVAVGDGSELPLIRQKSKIFATFPPGGRFVGRETRPLQEGGRLYGGEKREGVAKGDIFKNISEGNTTIVNCQLSIIHYKRGRLYGGVKREE